MSEYINKKTLIDKETGEILKVKEWAGFDGFTDKGYLYRPKCCFIRYYFDSLPSNFDKDTWTLMFMLAELMNEENALVYRIKRKSKFSTIIYKPYDKEEIRQMLRYPIGINKFDKCWKQLSKYVIKQAYYHDVLTWIVNPAIISKCRYLPYWLYDEFKEEINPHLSGLAIKKFNQRLLELED